MDYKSAKDSVLILDEVDLMFVKYSAKFRTDNSWVSVTGVCAATFAKTCYMLTGTLDALHISFFENVLDVR